MVKNRSPRDYGDLLRTGKWFAGLPEDLQDRLLHAATLRRLASGERLFSRGDAPCGLYAVVDGGIRVSGFSESGKEAVLTLLAPPTWFGEIAVFDRQPRTHDAVAEPASSIVHVPQAALERILDAHPRYWRELGLLVTSKLRLAFTAMEGLALSPIVVRLARRLAMMAEGYGEQKRPSRTLQVSQEQLAMMVSTSRQTANHLLKQLEAKGLIRLAYGSIEILDLEGLRDYAAA